MKQKDILFLSISTLILVILWIGFNLYHARVTSTIPETVSTKIIPINATFDKKTIEKLKTRKQVIQFQQASPSATAAPAPSITPTLTPPSSSSPSATPGGTP